MTRYYHDTLHIMVVRQPSGGDPDGVVLYSVAFRVSLIRVTGPDPESGGLCSDSSRPTG
jgi:hypothetical protein